MNVTNLMRKLTEELMRRTAFSLFKNIFSAIEGFDEKLQRIQIAVDEYSGSSKGKTANMLKSQRSNYAKLANELLMQSNIKCIIGETGGNGSFIQSQYKLLELEEQYLE